MNAAPTRTDRTSREGLYAFGFALAILLLLTIPSGLFNGGFLLWDDIIIADLHAGLKSSGFAELYTKIVQQDLQIRFRPLALLHYLVMAKLYGLHYAGLLAHNLVIASMACTFLYLSARRIGVSTSAAMLFVAVTCLGNQGVFAFRIVLAENPGMLFLSVSIFALTSQRRMLATLFFLLASLTKESFVLLAPALLWADILLQKEITLRGYISTHGKFVAAITAITASILAVIIFHVGTHSIGYAGVDRDTLSIDKLARAVETLLFLKGYALALVPLIWGLIALPDGGILNNRTKLINGSILCALVLFPQAALYAKSGIFMHYLLPAQLWSGLMVLMLWSNPLKLLDRHHLYFQSVVRVLVLFNMVLLVNNVRDIAHWGRDARQALEKVSAVTSPQDTILIVGHPVRDYEKATDAARFLASDLYLRPNASILPTTLTDSSGTAHEQKLTQRFLDANRTFINRRSLLFRNASCILFMPGALADLQQNDTTGTGINGMDTIRVASYIIATPAHK